MVSWKRLVDEALDPELEAQGSTLIVQNHMAQMKMFTHRGGVEFFPEQDDQYQSRKKFIDAEARYNKLPLKIDRAVDILTGRGELLIYFRPTQSGRYKIHIYEKGQYKAIYDNDGDLNKVIIVYSYEVENQSGLNRTSPNSVGTTRWLRLTVTAETILKEEFQSKPGFTNEFTNNVGGISRDTQEYINSLKFLPCVVVKNYFGDDGREGLSDFFPIRRQLENHDDLISSLNTNLKFFGNSTFVTSRSAKEVLQAFGGSSGVDRKDSLASRAGFVDNFIPSSYDKRFFGNGDASKRVTRIIDNIAPDERAGYISPDPITADHALHAREEREAIHFALGGLDELGISANATAYEMKTIYGKLAVTAGKKARALFDYGLCIVFEMMIAAEEDLFRQSLALVMGKELIEITDGFIADLLEQGKMPVDGIFGLVPVGDRQVSWRYRGEVFEKSARDLMDESIVVRNLQELGMSAADALKVTNLFENKTHTEIEAILSKGYPYRYIQSVLGASQFFASVYGQLLQLPDVMNGGQPLAMQFPVNQFIAKGFETIANELSYQDQFNPVNAGDPPQYKLGISQFNQYLNATNEPTVNATQPTNATPGSVNTADPTVGGWTVPSIYGFPATAAGQPSGSAQYGVGAGNGFPVPEYTAELPTPDTIVNSPGVQPWGQQPQYFGPVSAGYVPLAQPTVEPIPDDRTNADRTTRKPKSKSSPASRARRSARSRK